MSKTYMQYHDIEGGALPYVESGSYREIWCKAWCELRDRNYYNASGRRLALEAYDRRHGITKRGR